MSLEKRSLSLSGHRTSLALEPEFWAVLDAAVAAGEGSLAGLVGRIDRERVEAAPNQPLSSACRVWALARVQDQNRG